jgi:predicted GNAT family N-acyltransferase
MMKVVKVSNEDQLKDCFSIRQKVFIEEQGIDQRLEYDGLDNQCTHFLGYYQNQAVSCVRLRDCGESIKLERLATLPAFRGKGLGKLLTNEVTNWFSSNAVGKQLYLHAQDSAISFYQKLGWVPEGEPFTEAGIGHQKMIYKE